MYTLHLLSTADRTHNLLNGGHTVDFLMPKRVEPHLLKKFGGADGLSHRLFSEQETSNGLITTDRTTYIEIVRPQFGHAIIPEAIRGTSRVVMLVDEEGLITRPHDTNTIASLLYGSTINGPAFIFLEDLVFTPDGPDHVLRSFTAEEMLTLTPESIYDNLRSFLLKQDEERQHNDA